MENEDDFNDQGSNSDGQPPGRRTIISSDGAGKLMMHDNSPIIQDGNAEQKLGDIANQSAMIKSDNVMPNEQLLLPRSQTMVGKPSQSIQQKRVYTTA